MTVVLSGFSAFAVFLAASPVLADTGVHWTRAFSGPLFLLWMFFPFLLVALAVAAMVRLALHARPLWRRAVIKT